MKIVRFCAGGVESCGVLEGESIKAFAGEPWGERTLAGVEYKVADVKLLAPVNNPPDIFAIGLNYRAHADESGFKYPAAPVVFIKASSCVAGPEDAIELPAMVPDEVDYEAELVLVIGKTCRNVSEEDALGYVLGCTCGNDVSARDAQIKLDVQWARGKSFETFCPIGPWIETDADPENASVKAILNGEVMQSSNTNDLIFSCAKLVSFLSQVTTMKPGTLIMTGTPSGVGFTRKPPIFLKAGYEIVVEIGGVGTLTNKVK